MRCLEKICTPFVRQWHTERRIIHVRTLLSLQMQTKSLHPDQRTNIMRKAMERLSKPERIHARYLAIVDSSVAFDRNGKKNVVSPGNGNNIHNKRALEFNTLSNNPRMMKRRC